MSSRSPLYPRLLRLQHVHPNAWQRAVLGEVALGVALVLVLADVATAWTLLALPLAVAAVVKAHDLLAGALASAGVDDRPPGPAAVPRDARLAVTADDAGASAVPSSPVPPVPPVPSTRRTPSRPAGEQAGTLRSAPRVGAPDGGAADPGAVPGGEREGRLGSVSGVVRRLRPPRR